MKKRNGLIVLGMAAAVAFFVLAWVLLFRQNQDAAADVPAESCTVGLGDVEATITCSGHLEAEDTEEILLPEEIKIDTVFVKAGDIVNEGDVLAVLNAASLQDRAAKLSAELTALDRELGARKTASTIKTPVRGRVKYLPAAPDDDVIEAVNQYGALAILSTDGMMQVVLETKTRLTLSAEVTVRWNGGSADGKAASRTEGGYLITLDDAHAPYLGSADVYYDATLIGSGLLEIHAPLAIFGNGGTIKTIHVREGAQVDANATLFTLDNEPATDKYRQALADRNEKAAQLQTVLMYQNNPNVLAGVSGVVSQVGVTEGKKTAGSDGSSEVTAFTLGTGGATKMTVSVDELDISHVAVGQSATVTLDAFSTETFKATVTRISHIGEASGSITVYETDLMLAYDERLMDGMNGSAVIRSEHVTNAVIVPLAAVHEDAGGSFVYVLDGTETRKTYIETGLSDGTNAEVVKGLREGESIALSAQITIGGDQP